MKPARATFHRRLGLRLGGAGRGGLEFVRALGVLGCFVFAVLARAAGPYAPAADLPGSTAVALDSPNIIGWATGWTNYVLGANCDLVDYQNPQKALGPAVGDSYDVVTLGDGGRITLTFNPPIKNGPGFDFAVFENSVDDYWLELAYVEVSSDGTNFFRFPSHYLGTDPVGPYDATMDPTLIDGLAGKYRQGFGTPFDLAALDGVSPLLDVNAVRYVRIVDVLGDGSMKDSAGNKIYDPTPCYGSAGFDLEAVAVLQTPDTPLAVWRSLYFGTNTALALGSADPDGDGRCNLLEYAMGTDPLQKNTQPPVRIWQTTQAGQTVTKVQYQRRNDATDVALGLAVADRFANGTWRAGTNYFTEAVVATNGNRVTVEATSKPGALGQAQAFIRLKAVTP